MAGGGADGGPAELADEGSAPAAAQEAVLQDGVGGAEADEEGGAEGGGAFVAGDVVAGVGHFGAGWTDGWDG